MEEKEVTRVADQYKAAVYARDVAACMNLYDPQVCVFDLWGRWSYEGREAWESAVTEWFGSLGEERVVVRIENIVTKVSGDLAALYAFISYTGVSAQAAELRTMNNRLSWVLRRNHNGWKIIHEHTSAPADIETGKVMLQRQTEKQ